MDQEKNPWKVSKLEDFLYFCCPECNVKDKSKDFFIRHALDHHPKAKDILENSEFKKVIENLADSNVNHFSSDDDNHEEDSYQNYSNFEKYLKCEVKIESKNDKHEEEIKIDSKEILKKNSMRNVHENSKINSCETCGNVQNYFYSCQVLVPNF